jgi:hypothetical protein
MRRSWLLLPLTLFGCGPDIVLGDSEAALPIAGSPSSAGTNAVAGSAPSGGAGGSGGVVVNDGGASGDSSEGGALPAEPLPVGELLWSTDHEVGDFSDWQRGGDYYGGEYEWGDVDGYVDIGAGRDGSNGVVADIYTLARDETSGGVRMYRRIQDAPAYYSSWFRLEETHTVEEWWSIFLYHARDDTLSLDNDVSLWDVRLVDMPNGELRLQFFDHDTMQGVVAQVDRGVVKPGEWFELRAYLDYRPPNDTRLVIWRGSTLLFDMKSLHTAREKNVYWCVGNGAGRLSPADSTLYLDDAAIRGTEQP